MMRAKRKGYAITIEVILTMVMISMIANFTVWSITALNIERHVSTVLTSSVVQAAKWGGMSSDAYRANNGSSSIDANARRELRRTIPFVDTTVRASPRKVNNGNRDVNMRISWRYRSSLFGVTINKNLSMSMESIMRPGSLI